MDEFRSFWRACLSLLLALSIDIANLLAWTIWDNRFVDIIAAGNNYGDAFVGWYVEQTLYSFLLLDGIAELTEARADTLRM